MIYVSGIFGVINGVVLLYNVLLGNICISGHQNNLWPLWGVGADLKRIEMIGKFAESLFLVFFCLVWVVYMGLEYRGKALFNDTWDLSGIKVYGWVGATLNLVLNFGKLRFFVDNDVIETKQPSTTTAEVVRNDIRTRIANDEQRALIKAEFAAQGKWDAGYSTDQRPQTSSGNYISSGPNVSSGNTDLDYKMTKTLQGVQRRDSLMFREDTQVVKPASPTE